MLSTLIRNQEALKKTRMHRRVLFPSFNRFLVYEPSLVVPWLVRERARAHTQNNHEMRGHHLRISKVQCATMCTQHRPFGHSHTHTLTIITIRSKYHNKIYVQKVLFITFLSKIFISIFSTIWCGDTHLQAKWNVRQPRNHIEIFGKFYKWQIILSNDIQWCANGMMWNNEYIELTGSTREQNAPTICVCVVDVVDCYSCCLPRFEWIDGLNEFKSDIACFFPSKIATAFD